MDHHAIWEIAVQQSAYDCNCVPKDFVTRENSVHESIAHPKARRYLKLPQICNLVSYGTNIIATGRADLLADIKQFIDHISEIEHCFETPGLYALNKILEKADASVCFMAAYFLPDIEEIFGFQNSCPYELRVVEAEEFAPWYTPEWKNALCADRKHLDKLAVGAFDKGKLIGLAGCSADCDTMWQIGVDVLPTYRRQGIAAALTNRLARETFAREFVPFYCAAWSNVKSVRNAIRSGFRPGWVEITAMNHADMEDILREA